MTNKMTNICLWTAFYFKIFYYQFWHSANGHGI